MYSGFKTPCLIGCKSIPALIDDSFHIRVSHQSRDSEIKSDILSDLFSADRTVLIRAI